jgi:hypothetical protein
MFQAVNLSLNIGSKVELECGNYLRSNRFGDDMRVNFKQVLKADVNLSAELCVQ